MGKYIRVVFILYLLLSFLGSSAAGQNQGVNDLNALALQGDTKAMCDLALVYYNGKGVLKDPVKARCWIQKADAMGDKRAGQIWNTLALWRYTGDCENELNQPPLPLFREGDRWLEPVSGMTFVWVPGDCFYMGCHKNAGKCNEDELPLHRVCLDGFWISSYEVTQAQWQSVMKSNPSRFKSGGRYPVETVSFNQVKKFIQELNSLCAHTFSLPTEAQWEYVCRNGGQPIPYFWGREEFRPKANCGTCDAGRFRGRTAPSGSFPPNRLGVFDMGGNVREWCRDIYGKSSYAAHTPDNPVSRQQGRERVVRGGAFSDNVNYTGCTRRTGMTPSVKSQALGFRLVVKRRNG